jgi:L-serine dehydratase
LAAQAIAEALAPLPTELRWHPGEILPEHPTGLRRTALDAEGTLIAETVFYSIGGGAIKEAGKLLPQGDIYDATTMAAVLDRAGQRRMALWQYVYEAEGNGIEPFLAGIWQTMTTAIDRGLNAEGALPGSLRLERKARSFYLKTRRANPISQRAGYLSAYALAVAEENAAGGRVVTAPTCGSCGVLPSVLKYLLDSMALSEREILHALAAAGLIGNLIKHNASISGAVAGCQAEIGAACAMAAGAAAALMGGTIRQIEYAAEMGLEHHLGLTCDPIDGLVQIPCIERNAVAAMRAMDCADYALLSDGHHRVSFDEVVETMLQTGLAMSQTLRETSTGGLAVICITPPQG